MTSLHRAAAFAGAAAIIVSLAGCGGSEKENVARAHPATGSHAPVTDASFKAQANSLCAAANAELKKMQAGFPSLASQTQADTAAEAFADRVDKLVHDVGALVTPPDLIPPVVHLLDQVTQVADRIHDQKFAFFKAVKTDPFAKADTESRALGLDACAGG